METDRIQFSDHPQHSPQYSIHHRTPSLPLVSPSANIDLVGGMLYDSRLNINISLELLIWYDPAVHCGKLGGSLIFQKNSNAPSHKIAVHQFLKTLWSIILYLVMKLTTLTICHSVCWYKYDIMAVTYFERPVQSYSRSRDLHLSWNYGRTVFNPRIYVCSSSSSLVLFIMWVSRSSLLVVLKEQFSM